MPVTLRYRHGGTLTAHERGVYREGLVSPSVQRAYRVQLLDRGLDHVSSIRFAPESGDWGQVVIDSTATFNRTANVALSDPTDHLHLDSKGLFTDRVLRIEQHDLVPGLSDWVVCPKFTGPCSAPTVTGHEITIEAQSMELWAMGTIIATRRWEPGMVVTDLIRAILHNIVGVPTSHLDIPDLAHKLPSHLAVGPGVKGQGSDVETWLDAVKYLAGSIACDLWPDPDAVWRLRPSFGRPLVYAWHGSGAVIGEPSLSTMVGGLRGAADDVGAIVNRVRVEGKTTTGKGKTHQVVGVATAPHGSRFAAHSLGYPNAENGLILQAVYSNAHIAKQPTADEIAQSRLKRSLQMAEKVEFTSASIPDLDIFDPCRLHWSGGTYSFDLLQSTEAIPWTAGSPTQIGVVDMLSSAAMRR